MPLCSFYTGKFTQCTNNTRHADHVYCGVHAAKAERLGELNAGGCPCVVANHWCGMPIQQGHAICERHNRRREALANREAERVQIQGAMMRLTDEYMLQNPIPEWTQVVDELQARMNLPAGAQGHVERLTAYAAARRFFLLTTPQTLPIAVLMHYWVGDPLEEAAPAAPAVPLGQMGALAVDTQNVHREVVVKQTNTNVEILLAMAEESPLDLDPEAWVATWWLLMPGRPTFGEYWRVAQDIHHWFGKRTCKAANDYLYTRVFTGTVYKISKIEDHALRQELAKRLWEECREAVDMCCEGHISRLANVFVGFDEAFKSPASPNEMLQTQIAEIAQLKLRPETKLAKAKAVMDELGIPEADRAPWLEALEE